jgi:hypothetical protein
LFYTDATNNRIGIGTSSPAYKLDAYDAVNGATTLRLLNLLGVTSGNQYGYSRFQGLTGGNGLFLSQNVNGINGAISALDDSASKGYAFSMGENYAGWAFMKYAAGAGNVTPSVLMLLNSSGIVTMSAYGAGTATFSAAGVISSVSDETWKVKDGVPTDPDAMLKKLEPGYWYYNDEKKETFGADRQLGFYAQNVNAAIGPEAAPTPGEGKPWGYYDRSVLAVTVMSLQKALATIESLVSRIAVLESKVL